MPKHEAPEGYAAVHQHCCDGCVFHIGKKDTMECPHRKDEEIGHLCVAIGIEHGHNIIFKRKESTDERASEGTTA